MTSAREWAAHLDLIRQALELAEDEFKEAGNLGQAAIYLGQAREGAVLAADALWRAILNGEVDLDEAPL